jgi:hypothetical protein
MTETPNPQPERLSALTALVLLTYGLVKMIVLPVIEAETAFLGLLVSFEFKTQSLMLGLAAALAVAGTDWLLRGEKGSPHRSLYLEHYILPALAAWAVGMIVIRIPEGPYLWLGIILGAAILVAVVSAEFIASFPDDPRYGGVSISLHGLAFFLLAGSFFTTFSLELRALFSIPLLALETFAVSWRLLQLSFPGQRTWSWAALISLLTAQVATGLHYWPLPPLRGALLLALTIYLSYQFIAFHLSRISLVHFLLENGLLAAIALTAIITLT